MTFIKFFIFAMLIAFTIAQLPFPIPEGLIPEGLPIPVPGAPEGEGGSEAAERVSHQFTHN